MPADAYIGDIMIFAGNFAPQGFLECNGQVLAIAAYDVLFQVIGTTFGGNGVTTFALPDLRGRCALSSGQGNGLTPRTLGASFGNPAETLTVAQIPAHNHSVNATTSPGTAPTIADAVPAVAEAGANPYFTAAPTATTAPSTSSFGGNLPHNNMQPSRAILHCICYQGIFPPRP